MIRLIVFLALFFIGCATPMPPYHQDDSGRMAIVNRAYEKDPPRPDWEGMVRR